MTTEGRRLWRLHTKIANEDGKPVLFVGGRLDHESAAELEAATIELERADGNVIVDLSGVEYISSAALKLFQALADRQSGKGGRLLLRAPSTAARVALDLSGLLSLIERTRPL